MESNLFGTIAQLLRTHKISAAVDLMKAWLTTAAPGEPEDLLAQCPAAIKPSIVELLRDLLSRYPYTLVGMPTMLYIPTELSIDIPKLPMPHPAPEAIAPNELMHFIGWVGVDCALPVAVPFKQSRYPLELKTNELFVAVALFKSHPTVFESPAIHVPNAWWAALFSEAPGPVHLSARALNPYPDALESAREMHRTITGQAPAGNNHFISENGVIWARSASALFQESCRQVHTRKVIT